MASVVVNGDTSGAVTLSAPAVAGTVTVTLPSTTGTMAVLPTATGVLAESAGGTGTTTGYYGFKNRIINGAMVIDQRNAGASVTVTTTDFFTCDRWREWTSVTSKYSVEQTISGTAAPTGFTDYLGVTSLSAYSVLSSDNFSLYQAIEGFNSADLGWGAAGASAVTLSFWVRSSLTGTFGGALSNSAVDRSYPYTYTISVANTWEKKTVTIAGDTTGTWFTDNRIGIRLWFSLGAGSTYLGTAGAWAGADYRGATGQTSVVGTNGATFYITGVQLEKGSTATSFDYRPYGTELQLCQRYFETNYPSGVATGSISLPGFVSTNSSSNSSNEASGVQFSVKKRATPTIVIYHITTGTAGQVYRVSDAASVGVTSTHIGQSGIGFLALASSSANGYYWNYTASAEL